MSGPAVFALSKPKGALWGTLLLQKKAVFELGRRMIGRLGWSGLLSNGRACCS